MLTRIRKCWRNIFSELALKIWYFRIQDCVIAGAANIPLEMSKHDLETIQCELGMGTTFWNSEAHILTSLLDQKEVTKRRVKYANGFVVVGRDVKERMKWAQCSFEINLIVF